MVLTRCAILAIVPPLLLCGTNLPRRSDPDLSSDKVVRIVWRLGGVLLESISVGLRLGLKSTFLVVVSVAAFVASVDDEDDTPRMMFAVYLDR